jgi:hypothetical protein
VDERIGEGEENGRRDEKEDEEVRRWRKGILKKKQKS